jgi:uncharacterized protein YhbP (UPF0306 family)
MPDGKTGEPDRKQLIMLAKELIDAQSTVTLATCDNNVAWAAPVYYVFFKSAFYFFSDPTSRHIVEALEGGQVSGAIHAFATGWKEIRGIQMTGSIEALSVGLEAAQVIGVYLKKYQFTKELFASGMAMDFDAFTSRFKVNLYRFSPTLMYYLDNRFRFGFRERVKL